MNLGDNTIEVLLNNVGGNGYPLSISPDGTFLLFVHANPFTVKRANLDSNGNMTGNLQTINVSGGVQWKYIPALPIVIQLYLKYKSQYLVLILNLLSTLTV